MKVGSPGFLKDRLVLAREARGVSATALAEMLGVTRSSVCQYESGQQTPSPVVLHSISTALNLPTSYFLKPAPRLESQIFYRSFSSATKQSRTRCEARLRWFREFIANVLKSIEIPSWALEKPAPKDLDDVEKIATETRRACGLGDGPISNVVRLIENQGVVVSRHFLESSKLDAFSAFADAFCPAPVIILGTDKMAWARSRFDAAHELGHLVMHRAVANVKSALAEIESQANRFAGAFLLPKATFLAEAKHHSLDHLLLLKARWGVSVGAMIHRLEDLGAIDAATAKLLYMKRAKRGWIKKEPLDSQTEPEVPTMLQKCIDVIKTSDAAMYSLMAASPFHTTEIEELASLIPGTLNSDVSDVQPRIIRFPSF